LQPQRLLHHLPCVLHLPCVVPVQRCIALVLGDLSLFCMPTTPACQLSFFKVLLNAKEWILRQKGDSPWTTFVRHSGLRDRYFSTIAIVMLLVSWPANSMWVKLSLIASSDITIPSSFGVVSISASRSVRGEAVPCSSSSTTGINKGNHHEGVHKESQTGLQRSRFGHVTR
jgi:hypothetical protein